MFLTRTEAHKRYRADVILRILYAMGLATPDVSLLRKTDLAVVVLCGHCGFEVVVELGYPLEAKV